MEFPLIFIPGPSRAKLGRTAQQQLLTLASLLSYISTTLSGKVQKTSHFFSTFTFLRKACQLAFMIHSCITYYIVACDIHIGNISNLDRKMHDF